MADVSTSQKRSELRKAATELRDRGLYAASKWAAEQLVGLRDDTPDQRASTSSNSSGRGRKVRADAGSHQPNSSDEEEDVYVLAKSYFDLKEYRRAAYVLRQSIGPKALFLRSYATYLAGEKRKEEERIEAAGPLGKSDAVNQELDRLDVELAAARDAGGADAFCLYMHGLVLSDKERKPEAQTALLQSLSEFPCNWSAWQALQALLGGRDDVTDLALPRHWMREFFLAAFCLELQHNQEGLSRLQELSREFPGSDWVISQAATTQYNLRNFDEAQELFEDLLERDPHRVEGMDTYSNILYVKELFAALSHLAHRTALTDKYRPEACCVIGNYYSLKGQHEKAVMYFRRALKLNRHYLSAWTLMGHEYVEMKNPPAAIEAYRRAVDLNPRDYRAWYGLGQTYELLQMPYYALYYFRRATGLRPHDYRMWSAMGQCYKHEQLRMLDAAIRCYRRAEMCGDRENIALRELAELHKSVGQRAEAAHYFRLNLERLDAEGSSGQDTMEALLFLSEYCKDTGALTDAEAYSMRLLDYGPSHKEKAKATLREIRALQQHSGPGGGGIGGGGAGPVTPPPPAGPGSSGSDIEISPGGSPGY